MCIIEDPINFYVEPDSQFSLDKNAENLKETAAKLDKSIMVILPCIYIIYVYCIRKTNDMIAIKHLHAHTMLSACAHEAS